MKLKYEFLKKLPKADLHVHLDGSLRIPTIFELAKINKVKLPANNEEDLKKTVCCDENTASLEEYLTGFGVTLSVLQTKEALERAAYELAEDAAAENVRYMEVRYSPVLHTEKGLKLTQISDAVIRGLQKAERNFNIKTGVIICGIRHMDSTTSLRLAELAIAYKNKGVVGFDLAGAEYNHPAKAHKEAFEIALRNNVNITVHAGEAYGPESIHQALHYCGTHRIGHGTRLIEDGDLLNYVNDHRIPMEICLKSNLHTKAVNSLIEHPCDFYLSYGLRVTLNTDNRLISDTSLTDEYMLAHEHLGLSYPELKNIIINGFKSAFAPYHQKVEIINKAISEMESLEEEELKSKVTIEETI
ncbi:MAG: adenosine deaminase [Candidatus Cloacimonadota bacterium]|nr:MAG: adenosine deaminase [Candidatus Cloacimonadota bacterium]